MKRTRFGLFIAFCATVALLGLTSFLACMAAEIKRAKRKDLKVDGKMCYLPGSKAFMYGLIALLCLSTAQIIGNIAIYKILCSRKRRNTYGIEKPIVPTILLVLSWISCALTILLLTGATSISRRQGYGKGWFNGECYLVKDGVYIISGVLVLATVVLTLSSAIITARGIQNQQPQKT